MFIATGTPSYELSELLSGAAAFRCTNDLDRQIQSDVVVHALLPHQSLPYWRDAGTTLGLDLQKPLRALAAFFSKNRIIKSVYLYTQSVWNSAYERRVVLGPIGGVNFFKEATAQGENSVEIRYFMIKDQGKAPVSRSLT